MSSINTTSEDTIGIRARLERGGWIQSAGFDGLLLIFAPLVTLPIMAGIYLRIPALAIGGFLTLAFAHYFSTVVFYFWDENREYYRARWLAFFAGPLFLAAGALAILSLGVPLIIPVIVFFWNTWHVARQNCGILSIYRSRAGVSDQRQKIIANRAIIAVSTFLAVWNIDTHPDVAALFGLVSDGLTRVVKIVAGVAAATFAMQLAFTLLRRREPIGIPEGLFLAASLLFFYPYLFLYNSEIATVAMLLPHYVQYLALVWLLHRRKFGGAIDGAPMVLRQLSSNLWLLIPVLFVIGFSFYLLRDVSIGQGYGSVFAAIYLLVALEHFYLDGLIWSFRRPHVRQTILPFLLRRPSAASAALVSTK
jgi:hypothetical protein